jgi:hypothetical protein
MEAVRETKSTVIRPCYDRVFMSALSTREWAVALRGVKHAVLTGFIRKAERM